jgi:hypothetical protein
MSVADPTDEEAAWALARSISPTDDAAMTLLDQARKRAEQVVATPDFQAKVARVASALLHRRVLHHDELTELLEAGDDDEPVRPTAAGWRGRSEPDDLADLDPQDGSGRAATPRPALLAHFADAGSRYLDLDAMGPGW